MKQASLRPLAEQDLLDRTGYHRQAGGRELAERFFDAAIGSLQLVEASPRLGSPRVGELIGVPGVRRVGVEGFSCGWLYRELDDRLDVIRLLADRQDISRLFDEPDSI